jgi:YD repeat-containing protein
VTEYHGQTTIVTNDKGQDKTTVLNPQGLVASVTEAIGKSTTYQYDPFGNLTVTTDSAGNEIVNTYDVRAARQRGAEEGLTQDEIAFYDALAENESAVEAMGNDALKLIAHELLESLQGNVTVDWSRRESARARMRVLVKRILRKHGYIRRTCRMRPCRPCFARPRRCLRVGWLRREQ